MIRIKKAIIFDFIAECLFLKIVSSSYTDARDVNKFHTADRADGHWGELVPIIGFAEDGDSFIDSFFKIHSQI